MKVAFSLVFAVPFVLSIIIPGMFVGVDNKAGAKQLVSGRG